MEKVKLLMNKYELGKLLGQGNFAKVYYARNLHTNQAVAVKVIDKDKVLKVGLDLQLKREISIMGMLRHRNVLQVYEVMASKSKIYIVLEYAKGGELFNKVAQGRLKEDVARWVFQQLISAVDFCHTRGVCHRDLKLENLLLDEAGNLKVSDFGLSTLLPDDGLLRTFCGTPTYVAPEVIIKKGYDGAKADIWSCGVILYSMLAGHLPFRDSNLNEIYRKIRRAEYKCPIWFPPEVHRLLAKILDPNPKRRISIAKIKENAWFKKGLGTKPAILESGAREASNAAIEMTSVQESGALPFKSMNAFEFISLSSGFDLSGLFVEDEQKDGARFISQQPASDIATKLEEAAAEFRMEVANKEGVFLRLLRADEEGNGSMMIDVEVSELAEKFHLVELKKSGGDSLDYRRLMKDMRPKLKEIVWAWQGNQIFRPEQFTL